MISQAPHIDLSSDTKSHYLIEDLSFFYEEIDRIVHIKDFLFLNLASQYGEFGTHVDEEKQLDRLFSSIENIAKMMAKKHIQILKSLQTQGRSESDLKNEITRVITNEFAFFTKKPLTFLEFTSLLTKIHLLASQTPENVHLALSSFAVKTPDNDELMNIVVYLECGQTPKIHCVAKRHASPLDPVYTEVDEDGECTPLPYLSNKKSISYSIEVNGQLITISFDNLFECTTAGGAKFYVCFDICLDHKYRLAQAAMINEILANKTLSAIQYSYFLTSNTIFFHPDNGISNLIVHADPKHPKKSRCELIDQGMKPLFYYDGQMFATSRRPLPILPLRLPSLELTSFLPADIHCRILQYFQNAIKNISNLNIPYYLKQDNVFYLLQSNQQSLHSLETLEALFHFIIVDSDPNNESTKQLHFLRQTEQDFGYSVRFESMLYLLKTKALELIRSLHSEDHFALMEKMAFYEKEFQSFKEKDIGIFCDASGKALIHQALIEDDYALLTTLCEQDSHLNVRNADGETPLEIAIKQQNNDIVTMLLGAGADANLVCSSEVTPLELALQYPNIKISKTLMSEGANVNQAYSTQEPSPLMQAYLLGDPQKKYIIIRELFLNGALPSLAKFKEKSLLELGMELKDCSLLKLLLHYTSTSFYCREQIKSIITKHKATFNPTFIAACEIGDTPLVDYLLNHMPTYLLQKQVNTALRYALKKAHFIVVNKILTRFPELQLEMALFCSKMQPCKKTKKPLIFSSQPDKRESTSVESISQCTHSSLSSFNL